MCVQNFRYTNTVSVKKNRKERYGEMSIELRDMESFGCMFGHVETGE